MADDRWAVPMSADGMLPVERANRKRRTAVRQAFLQRAHGVARLPYSTWTALMQHHLGVAHLIPITAADVIFDGKRDLLLRRDRKIRLWSHVYVRCIGQNGKYIYRAVPIPISRVSDVAGFPIYWVN